MKRIILALVLVVTALSIILTTACATTPAPTTPAKATTPTAGAPAAAPKAAEKPIVKVRFSFHSSETYPVATWVVKPWVKMVQDLSKGRIQVTVYWGGVLAKTEDAPDALIAGTCDVTHTVWYLRGDRYPLSAALGLPGVAPGFFRGQAVAEAIVKKYPEIAAEYKAVKPLTPFRSSANAILMSKKPFKTMDQAKGQKIRSGSGNDAKALGAWGFTPVTLGATEGYEAIKTGLLDGMQFSASGQVSYKIYELTKYAWVNTLVGNMGSPAYAANWDWYNKLDDEARLIVDYASTFISPNYDEESLDETVNAYTVFAKNGVAVYERDAADEQVWRDKIMFLWDEWEKDTNSRYPNNLGTRIVKDLKLEVLNRFGVRL